MSRTAFVFVLLSLSGVHVAAQNPENQLAPRPLITEAIDETQFTTLKGNVHPLARPQFDLGSAPASLPMQRMLLVLKRSPEQESALRKLLDDQQDKSSPNYHKWLSPEDFGRQFGPTDADMQTITTWLQSHGFQVAGTKGRAILEFSGSASQVQQTFHTTIHKYLVNGQQHWANASDPQIPAALASAVAGTASLNNFPRKAMNAPAGRFSRDSSTGKIQPDYTFPGGCVENNFVSGACVYGLGPYDFATIYDVQPLWTAGINGTGQTIAIVGETNINIQDVADFRSMFGLPVNNPNIILNGPDPGIQGDESEADIDVQWSGAVAPNATIDFVVSQSTETTAGIDLSAVYIVENNLAPVMSESYGYCELGLGTAGNQFYNALWQQAAAEGISVFISAGDSGAAGCDNFDAAPPAPAEFGLQVSGFASTPYNIAVGGTDFNDLSNPGTYWSTTNNSTTQASALSYIPETTWNDSCTNSIFGTVGYSTNAETNCNDSRLINFVSVEGGSGGVSKCTTPSGLTAASCAGGYSKPSWQSGTGVPADGKRDLPDVSLFASNGFLGSFYIICQSDQTSGSCNLPGGQFLGFGGTSVSSPAFAGLMALVNQQTGQRQGNANYVFYKLATQQPAVFHDVASGTIAMPCQTGSPNCTTSTGGHQYGVLSGYAAGANYDQATGLGSVDANLLVTKWSTVTLLPSATTLTNVSPTTITHGQAVSFTATVKPTSGTGTPTGLVSLEGGPSSSTEGIAGFSLTSGTVSGSTELLPGGTYALRAHYPGDSTYASSDSTPVTVTVNKENSQAEVLLETFDLTGHLLNGNANTAAYGSLYLLRVNVENAAGQLCSPTGATATACPAGEVTLTDNGNPLDLGGYSLNSYGYFEDQLIELAGGAHSVKAVYAGDESFNSSSNTSSLSITQAATTVGSPAGCCTGVGSSYSVAVSVQSQSSGAAPTGTVSFLANGKSMAGTVSYQSQAGSGFPPTASLTAYFNSSSTPFPTPGTYTLTASYGGDTNYAAATSSPTVVVSQFPPPNISLQPSSSTVAAGASIVLTATVGGYSSTLAPTGTISFGAYEGAVAGAVSYSTVTDTSTGNLDLQGSITIAPAFSDFYSAQYSGDPNFPSAQTAGYISSVAVTGNDFSILALPQEGSLTLTRGAAGSIELLAGLQSGASPVTLSCAGLPSQTACSLNPNPVSSTGGFNLQITTTAPSAADHPRKGASLMSASWLTGATALMTILLITPRRRMLRASLTCLAFAALLAAVACGGSSGSGSNGGGGGGGGSGNQGTPVGTYNITVTGTSGSSTHSASVQLIVQ